MAWHGSDVFGPGGTGPPDTEQDDAAGAISTPVCLRLIGYRLLCAVLLPVFQLTELLLNSCVVHLWRSVI